MAKTLANMTVEELQAENHRLMAEKAGIRERQREIAALLDTKIAEEEAARKVAAMSDTERRALAQVIHAKGIESEEQAS